jgi:DNA-binding PadR family transcriptional regulator
MGFGTALLSVVLLSPGDREEGVFRYLVLGLLRDGKPRHGYALMKEYADRSGLRLSTGSFYRELQRLSTEGLVRGSTNPEGADPRRVPYTITDVGVQAFDAWLAGPDRPPVGNYEDDLSCRAIFVSEATPAIVRAILERWQEALWINGKLIDRAREAAVTRPR